MVFDCRELSYITAAGLRAMVNVARAIQKLDGSLAVLPQVFSALVDQPPVRENCPEMGKLFFPCISVFV